MDIPLMRRFVAVAEYGSLNEAARHLNITQPAITRSIQLLEQHLDAPLLERFPTGVRLTIFGEGLLPYARAILSNTQQAADAVAAIRGNLSGLVAFGVTPNFAADVVPQSIANITSRWPDIRISVHVELFEQLVLRLRRSEIDFVFSIIPPPSLGMLDDDLRIETVAAYRNEVFARAGHPLSDRQLVSLGELAACDWIIISQQPGMTNYFYERFVLRGLKPPRQVIEVNSTQLLTATLARTDAIAALPNQLVEKEVARGEIIQLPTQDFSIDVNAGFVHGNRKLASPAVVATIDELRRQCLGGDNNQGSSNHPRS